MQNCQFFKPTYTKVSQDDFFSYECHGGLNKIEIGKKEKGFNMILHPKKEKFGLVSNMVVEKSFFIEEESSSFNHFSFKEEDGTIKISITDTYLHDFIESLERGGAITSKDLQNIQNKLAPQSVCNIL